MLSTEMMAYVKVLVLNKCLAAKQKAGQGSLWLAVTIISCFPGENLVGASFGGKICPEALFRVIFSSLVEGSSSPCCCLPSLPHHPFSLLPSPSSFPFPPSPL